jgi:hypothetical protein
VYSGDLRIATAQHVVFSTICDWVWQPFFSSYLWNNKQWNNKQWNDKQSCSPLTKIYSRLAPDGENFQQNWKISTLKGLADLDESVDTRDLFKELIDHKVITPLRPLLDDEQLEQFESDLKDLLRQAVELGKLAERDQFGVVLDRKPTLSNCDGWQEKLTDEDGTDMLDGSPTGQATTTFHPRPLFVSPKIYREGRPAQMKPLPALPPLTASTVEGQIELIQPGIALFPDTGIFQKAWSEHQIYQDRSKELLVRDGNGRGRRASTTTSLANSTILQRSPVQLQPSSSWSARKLNYE